MLKKAVVLVKAVLSWFDFRFEDRDRARVCERRR